MSARDLSPTRSSTTTRCCYLGYTSTSFAAGDQDAIEILKGISPVAWRNVNLIGNFDFTTATSRVDIEALAARYENPDFWRRSLQEADDDGPAY
jgi:hypothetical protein